MEIWTELWQWTVFGTCSVNRCYSVSQGKQVEHINAKYYLLSIYIHQGDVKLLTCVMYCCVRLVSESTYCVIDFRKDKLWFEKLVCKTRCSGKVLELNLSRSQPDTEPSLSISSISLSTGLEVTWRNVLDKSVCLNPYNSWKVGTEHIKYFLLTHFEVVHMIWTATF